MRLHIKFDLDKHLEEVQQKDPLSTEEEATLLQRIGQGDKESLDALVKSKQYLVEALERQGRIKSTSQEERLTVANKALKEAAVVYVKEQPREPFYKYAGHRINDALDVMFIKPLAPEEQEALEHMHKMLLEKHAQDLAEQEVLRERFMQGDHSMLEEAVAHLENEHQRTILQMRYGIGMPPKTTQQIAEILGTNTFNIRFALVIAKKKLGKFYCELLEKL